jgi:hypothetical protein
VRSSGVFTTNVYIADPLVQVQTQTASIRVTIHVQKGAGPQH